MVVATVRALKAAHPDLGVLCDVALDPYTSHGQDGLLDDNVYAIAIAPGGDVWAGTKHGVARIGRKP